MIKIIYHGSEEVITKPQFGKGLLQNDYGKGFYCIEQIVLKSQKAFENICFVESFAANKEEWFLKKSERDKHARQEYRSTKKNDVSVNDIYIIDIMREGMKNDDPRLF